MMLNNSIERNWQKDKLLSECIELADLARRTWIEWNRVSEDRTMRPDVCKRNIHMNIVLQTT